MAQLIDKDAVVAEIKRISCENPMDNSWYVDTEELLNFINTLEVKLEVEEEPVSEDLGDYISELSKQFPEVSFAKLSRIAVRVSRWQQNQDVKNKLPKVTDRTDLDEYAYQCAYDMSNDWAIDNPTWKDVEDACKLGAKWQKEQMMKDAMPVIISNNWGHPEFNIEHFMLEPLGIKSGDKVKIIIVKEGRV